MSTSPGPDAGALDVDTQARHALVNDEDDIAHLVCCRDEEWRAGLCGTESEGINLTPAAVCTMCLEVAERMLPGFTENDPPVCPVDHRPCPDEHDIDLRILREVSS